MAVTGFAHYNLKASPELIEQLKHFYCDVIGLKTGPRPPLERFGYWLYVGNEAIVHLIENEPGQPRPANVLSTIDHFAFYCTDYAAMQEHLNQHQIRYRASTIPRTGERQLFLYDPAGNGVELNFAPQE